MSQQNKEPLYIQMSLPIKEGLRSIAKYNHTTISNLIEEFSKIEDIYVADGHHRIASSKLYSNSKNQKDKLAHYFLSFYISESSLKIFAYHRFIKTIGDFTENQFLNKIKTHFKVNKQTKEFTPLTKHSIGLYHNEKWYELTVKASFIKDNHPTSSLDTQLLSELLLDPILDIKDLKTDERVDFFNGARDIEELTKMVDKSDNGAAFVLYPHVFEEIKKVADTKNSMPPKSTWIEPKIRSGLTIYEL